MEGETWSPVVLCYLNTHLGCSSGDVCLGLGIGWSQLGNGRMDPGLAEALGSHNTAQGKAPPSSL